MGHTHNFQEEVRGVCAPVSLLERCVNTAPRRSLPAKQVHGGGARGVDTHAPVVAFLSPQGTGPADRGAGLGSRGGWSQAGDGIRTGGAAP